MTCRRCKTTMQELPRVSHGKRKFRCPKCGAHRMQEAKTRKQRKQPDHRPSKSGPDSD